MQWSGGGEQWRVVIVRFLRVVVAVNKYEDVPAGDVVQIRRASGTSWSLELEQREQSLPSTYIPGLDDITNHETQYNRYRLRISYRQLCIFGTLKITGIREKTWHASFISE